MKTGIVFRLIAGHTSCMGLLKDAGSITDSVVIVVVGSVTLAVPGTVLMLVYATSLFESIDIFKILLIVVGFGIVSALPAFLTCLVMNAGQLASDKAKGMGVAYLILSSSVTAITSTLLLLVFWLSTFSLEAYLITHTIVCLLVLPIAFGVVLSKAKASR